VTTDNNTQERHDLYKNTRDDLLKRQLSNSERLDGAILTLSTGTLGLSLAFIKDIVPISSAVCLLVLKASWWAFGCSIVLTLLSFVASQLAIKKQLIYAKKYYLDKKDKYLTRTNDLARLTDILNYSSCAVFICAIVFTIVFVSSNIGGEGMTAKKSAGSESGRGQAIPTMQKVFTGRSVSMKMRHFHTIFSVPPRHFPMTVC
jgi:hypothetical protein